MAYTKKTWKPRISQYPGRRRMVGTGEANTYDITRAEGTVTQTGDAFSADNMNDLETRIGNEFTAINNNLSGYGTNTNGSYWKFPDGTLICAKEVTAQVTCDTPWGALYESGAINLGNFPMAFKSRPFITLSNTTQFTAGFFVENPIGASATSAGRTFVARATMTSSPIEYTICVIAIGRWQ